MRVQNLSTYERNATSASPVDMAKSDYKAQNVWDVASPIERATVEVACKLLAEGLSANLCIVKDNKFHTLASTPMRRLDKALAILKRLYLARRFGNKGAFIFLGAQPFATIIPLIQRDKSRQCNLEVLSV